MAGEDRYILTPYGGMSTRFDCPSCGRKKEYSRYIDAYTGLYMPYEVGRCNKEDTCAYHYKPKHYFADNNIKSTPHSTELEQKRVIVKPKKDSPASLIDGAMVKASLCCYCRNNLYVFLSNKYGKRIATRVLKKYKVGTSKHWLGATVFYQMLPNGNVRAGKIMLYDQSTGKRVKGDFTYITWLHSVLKLKDFHLKQSLFGLHLLDYSNKPVAIVESEKTAIIASLYIPDFIWLATGGSNNINERAFKPLQGRKVTFYPDCGAFGKWYDKVQSIAHLGSFSVSDYLEVNASEEQRNSGADIADLLLMQDLEQCRLSNAFAYCIERVTASANSEEEARAKRGNVITSFLKRGLDKEEAKEAVRA